MEENKNTQWKQTEQGSVFLTQIEDKSWVDEQKKVKKSVFSQFTEPNLNPQKTSSVVNQKTKKGLPILGILAGVAILFLLFVVLMVVVIAMGDANNSLLVAFGIDESRLKDVLLFIVNASFGIVSFAMLLVFVISVFRISILKKEEKEKRKRVLKHLFVSLSFLIFVLVTWFGSWKIVNGIKLNIPLNSLEIKTNPVELTNLVAPVEISFDAIWILEGLASRGNKPESIGWDFNEDWEYEVLSSDESVILHRFEQEGNIEVGLVVNLKDGQKHTFTKLVQIDEAEFITNPQSGNVPLEVAFDASSLERSNSASSFEWDFDGDGVYDQKNKEATAEYTFEKIGIYNVGLRIVDIHNNFRVYSKKVEVVQDTQKKLKASIRVSPSVKGNAPFKVSLSGADSFFLDGDIEEYEWDFGDKSAKQFGRTVSHVYKNAGLYEVTLTIYAENGEKESDSLEIQVEGDSSIPVAKIVSKPALEKDQKTLQWVVPFSVYFDASASEDDDDNIIEYAWDFDGDEEFDEFGQKLTHVFEKEGSFEIVLRVTDADEQSSKTSFLVETKARELQAILLAEPLSGSVPLKVDFDASTSVYKKGNIVTYEWDFGDGGGAEYGDAHRTHIYDKEGRYKVRVKVITDDEQEAETTRDIFVRALKLQACFSASEQKGVAPLTVDFDASCTQGEVTKWKWEFGDGFISTSYSPTHTFREKGSYMVSLELIDEKNNSSSFESVIVVE